MIGDIMAYCQNHFVKSCEFGSYEIVSDGITGDFTGSYVVGMYVLIHSSYVNDGVYKVTAVTSEKLTLNATLTAENTGKTIYLYGCCPPKDFVNLVTEITAYTAKDGVKSESIDDYSVTYALDGSWQSVYGKKLTRYKRIYDDVLSFTPYSVYNKRWL